MPQKYIIRKGNGISIQNKSAVITNEIASDTKPITKKNLKSFLQLYPNILIKKSSIVKFKYKKRA